MARQVCSLICVLAGFLIARCPGAFSQEGFPLPQPQHSFNLQQSKHIPVFGGADEYGALGDLEYYAPQPGFDRLNRDIDAQVARLAVEAHYQSGWEFQFEGIGFRAHGTSTEDSSEPNPPPLTSDALGLGAGPLVRWNFLQFNRYRVFVDAQASVILADRPFPNRGTIYDFFLRGGGGASAKISDAWWIESAFRFAHISNGQCFCSGNPAWQGNGISVGVRHSFVHEPEEPRSRNLFGKADENAWVTSVEDYTPTPGLNREQGKVEDDIRAFTISRAWHFPNTVEFQLGLSARGTEQQPQEVAGFGPALRWNLVDRRHWRLFTEGGVNILQTGSPAFFIPNGGVGYNGFFPGGGGTSVRLSHSYLLESSFRWAHVTTGVGPGASNLQAWSGQGLVLGLRHVAR